MGSNSASAAIRAAAERAAYGAHLRELFNECKAWAMTVMGCAEPRAIDWAAAQVYEPEGRRLMQRIAAADVAHANPF